MTDADRCPAGCTSGVPATSANLGPGFDAVGAGPDLHDDVVARANDERAGANRDSRARVRAPFRRTSRTSCSGRCGPRSTGSSANLRASLCSASTGIPHGRGLGSSSAAIVAGVLLARSDRSPAEQRRCRTPACCSWRPTSRATRQRRTVPAGVACAWPGPTERRDSRAAGANRAGDPTGCARAADPIRDPPCARSAAEPGAAHGRDAHGRPSRAADGGAGRSARRRGRPARRDRGSIAPALSRGVDAGVGCAGRGPSRAAVRQRCCPGRGRQSSSWPGTTLRSRGSLPPRHRVGERSRWPSICVARRSLHRASRKSMAKLRVDTGTCERASLLPRVSRAVTLVTVSPDATPFKLVARTTD